MAGRTDKKKILDSEGIAAFRVVWLQSSIAQCFNDPNEDEK